MGKHKFSPYVSEIKRSAGEHALAKLCEVELRCNHGEKINVNCSKIESQNCTSYLMKRIRRNEPRDADSDINLVTLEQQMSRRVQDCSYLTTNRNG